jgi:hypothetical protein
MIKRVTDDRISVEFPATISLIQLSNGQVVEGPTEPRLAD